METMKIFCRRGSALPWVELVPSSLDVLRGTLAWAQAFEHKIRHTYTKLKYKMKTKIVTSNHFTLIIFL
jgi:hypothetical protein